MPEQKTKPGNQSVNEFIAQIESEEVRDDCNELIRIMKRITGKSPVLWGDSIVGFGKYHYKYDSGHEGDSCLTGFSPRKQNISVYLMPGFSEQGELLKNLGKHKAAKGCLYIKKLDHVNVDVLESLIRNSVEFLKRKYTEVN